MLDGFEACRAELAQEHPSVVEAEVLACSSAGGGLRVAVVGNEELVTAEAGRRVALSSGGKVVAVLSRASDEVAYHDLARTTRPDVVLLTGGTDGGDEDGVLPAAARLAAQRLGGPRGGGGQQRRPRGRGVPRWLVCPVVVAENVVPRIGVLAPDSARQAIRAVFLQHVIGGKQLSSRADFPAMVRGATPDLVLTGVELLAGSAPRTSRCWTSAGRPPTCTRRCGSIPRSAGLSREVVASTPLTRTVEGDLGMRWSAASTWEAGAEAGLVGERAPRRRRTTHG